MQAFSFELDEIDFDYDSFKLLPQEQQFKYLSDLAEQLQEQRLQVEKEVEKLESGLSESSIDDVLDASERLSELEAEQNALDIDLGRLEKITQYLGRRLGIYPVPDQLPIPFPEE